MSDQVVLWYETEAESGTPVLKVHSGKPPFDSAELEELDRAVRSRYERLARGSGGPLTLRSHRFEVEVKPGINPRQPKLVLWLRPAGANGAAAAPTADWTAGFFEELRQQCAAEVDPPLPVHEKGSLATVLDELRSLTEASGVGLGAVLLAGYLATAEQHCRERDPARAGVYVLALRGLSRFLAEPEGGSITRERLLAGATASADHRLPAWIGRFFGWITGAPGGNGPR